MPTELVVSGPVMDRDGQKVEPMAPIHICEECGYRGAPFGVVKNGVTLSYCGWVGEVVCVRKGR